MDFKYLIHLAKLASTNIHPGGSIATNILIDKLNIKTGQNILEVGCGTGNTMINIASRYQVSMNGIDILPQMIDRAKYRIKLTCLTNKIQVSNITESSAFPFDNESFDRVYSESVIGFQTTGSVKRILSEVHRVLKKGGIYATNEAIWKKNTTPELINSINTNAEHDFGLTPASNDILYINDWMKIFNDSGFEVLSCEEINSDKNENKLNTLNYRIILSYIYTNYSKAKIIFNPFIFKEYLHYRRVLKKHKQDTPVLESRIFVLNKK